MLLRVTGTVWSYPNLHGDVIVTTDSVGIRQLCAGGVAERVDAEDRHSQTRPNADLWASRDAGAIEVLGGAAGAGRGAASTDAGRVGAVAAPRQRAHSHGR